MEMLNVQRNEIVCQEGSSGDRMYIIRSGKAEVFKRIENEDVSLTILSQGDFFGEISLLLGIPRTASIRALEDVQIESLDKKEFFDKMRTDHEFMASLLVSQAQRLVESHKIISRFKGEKDSYQIMYGARTKAFFYAVAAEAKEQKPD